MLAGLEDLDAGAQCWEVLFGEGRPVQGEEDISPQEHPFPVNLRVQRAGFQSQGGHGSRAME